MTHNKTINLLLVCCLFLITTTPLITIQYGTILIPVLLLFWCLQSFVDLKGVIKLNDTLLLSFILLFLILIYRFFSISSASWGNYVSQIYFYISIWIMVYINRHYSYDEKKTLAKFCSFIIVLNLLSNVYMYFYLPSVTNWSYVGASKIEEFVERYNLGSTSFVNMIMLFTGIFASIVNWKTNSKEKNLLFLSVVFLGVFYIVFCSGRATSSFIVFVLLLNIILFKSKYHSSITVIFLSVFFLIVSLFRIPVLRFLERAIPNERISVRINALYQYFQGSDEGQEYLNRVEILKLDIDTWLSNAKSFFFGIGDHRFNSGHLNEIYTIGISGHSSYLDFLAQYGLIGFILLNLLLISIGLYLFKTTKQYTPWNTCLIAVYIAFIVRSFIGNVFSVDIASLMFVFAPISNYLIMKGNILRD